jgi:hypothetical protein
MMAKQAKAPPEGADQEPRTAERRVARIVQSVMAALGRPSDFLRATVTEVRTDTFRVNVVTGPDAAAARIAHSFFVTVDENGAVTNSSPAVVKSY